ncbi:MAG: AAA family ATPase, partial [Verrucomicrobiota bacterium]
EINGVGFRTADQIARNIGLHNDNPQRLEAGLIFYLEEYEALGNTVIDAGELITETAKLLEIEEAYFNEPLKDLIKQGALISGGQLNKAGEPMLDPSDKLQLPKTHRAEVVIAQAIHDLLEAPSCLPPIIAHKAVDWAQERAGFTFAPEQAQAIHAALEHKVSVLTGGPGTGKTTILVALADILKAKKVRLLMAAPTGRAAQRMSETTRCHAQTIHRLLKFDPAEGGFSHHADNPLACDYLVVDEASMLDSKLAACLLRAIPHRAHLLLVGDADQLPSVGAGNVLADLITYIEGYYSASSQSPQDSMP